MNRPNIQGKVNKYNNANYNINQAIKILENVRATLNNKKYFESDKISELIKEIDLCINDLKSKKNSISSSIHEICIEEA